MTFILGLEESVGGGVQDTDMIAVTSVCLHLGGHPNLQFTTVWHLLHCSHVCCMYPRIEEYNIIWKYEEKIIGRVSQETGYLEVSWKSIFQQPSFLTFTYFHCLNLTHVMFFLGHSHGSTNSEHSLVPINEGKKSEVRELMSHGFSRHTCLKWMFSSWQEEAMAIKTMKRMSHLPSQSPISTQ